MRDGKVAYIPVKADMREVRAMLMETVAVPNNLSG